VQYKVVDLGMSFPIPMCFYQSELGIKIYGQDTLFGLFPFDRIPNLPFRIL